MRNSTIRPGLLVSLKTSVQGGVAYRRVDLEQDHVTEEGARRARWETERTIEDAQEFEAATKARSRARSVITGVCSATEFGLLCPESRESDLESAITEARRIADEHNAKASRTQVAVYVICGRVASNDEEAMRAINSEVRDLLDRMDAGIREADPEKIRDAANRARSIGTMLSSDAAQRVTMAVKGARDAARELVSRVQKGGELASKVVAELSASAKIVQGARFAFLDMDDPASAEPLAPMAPSIDLEELNPRHDTEPERKASAPAAAAFEL